MSDEATPPLFSPLDSQRFGIRIGRAELTKAGDLAATQADCEEEAIEMLIVRCQTDDFASVHGLEAAGARLTDTLVYHQRNLRKGAQPEELRPNMIRPIEDADHAGLPALVGETFRGYLGHYHADPRLDREKCDEGYIEWAMQMCLHRNAASEILVADDVAGHLIGFATLRLNSPQEGEGVLFGVHPSAVGRGIYWSMMIRAMEWCRLRGATRMLVSTQITNVTVQKTWARLGFELARSSYTFHLWRS